MEVKVYDLDGSEKGKIKLPRVFATKLREDLIRRAVLAIQSWRRQPYGADKLAGKRTSAHYHGRRDERWTMMGRGMSRLPRIHGEVGHLVWRARFAPQAVKGRKAHPPKPEKKWVQKINKKELLLAFKSALAACANLELVKKRGHRYDGEVPIVVDEEFENLEKTREVTKVLKKLGLEKELERAKQKKIRAGKGKRRGRKYRKKKGPIIVVSKECKLLKAAKNVPGVDVITVDELKKSLNVELLAPGAHPGRLLIVTKPAIEALKNISIEEIKGVKK